MPGAILRASIDRRPRPPRLRRKRDQPLEIEEQPQVTTGPVELGLEVIASSNMNTSNTGDIPMPCWAASASRSTAIPFIRAMPLLSTYEPATPTTPWAASSTLSSTGSGLGAAAILRRPYRETFAS